MKRIFILAVISVSIFGCQQMQQQNDEHLIEAGKKMQAAMRECAKEPLSRQNAVEQIECIGNAKRRAVSGFRNPHLWIVEQDIAADRESAIEYEQGKISEKE